jgi:hypothetical protein
MSVRDERHNGKQKTRGLGAKGRRYERERPPCRE